MTLEKIEDAPIPLTVYLCLHPEHSPPGMIGLESGTYKHTCPGCGVAIIFTVPKITC